jgi:hypothetical protein
MIHPPRVCIKNSVILRNDLFFPCSADNIYRNRCNGENEGEPFPGMKPLWGISPGKKDAA